MGRHGPWVAASVTSSEIGNQTKARRNRSMDFSAQLDELQQRVAAAKSAAQAAATESRDQLRRRIDQAQVDINLAVNDAQQQAGEAAASARGRGAQMKAAAAAIDYAEWSVDSARLAVLDAIDARAYADERAKQAGS